MSTTEDRMSTTWTSPPQLQLDLTGDDAGRLYDAVRFYLERCTWHPHDEAERQSYRRLLRQLDSRMAQDGPASIDSGGYGPPAELEVDELHALVRIATEENHSLQTTVLSVLEVPEQRDIAGGPYRYVAEMWVPLIEHPHARAIYGYGPKGWVCFAS